MKLAILAIVLTFACGTMDTRAVAEGSTDFSESEVCRAAISTIMGRPVHRVRVEKIARDGVVFLFYIRAEDRTTWSFKCFTEKNVVTWGNADGRWRVDPLDSTVTFFASDEVLTVTEDYGDGSTKKENFTRADLEKPYR